MNDDVLKHYGILGMKWGVRRKQNSAGRVSKSDPDNQEVRPNMKTKRKQMSVARRHLSDGDIKAAIERIQNEKKLKDLIDEDLAPGRTAVNKILKQVGTSVLTTVGTSIGTYAVKAAMEGKFDMKEAAKFIQPKKK